MNFNELTKSQKYLLIALAVVLVFAAGDVLMNMDRYSSFYLGKKDQAVTPVKKGRATAEEQAEPGEISYLKDWGSDPFNRGPKVVPRKEKKRVSKPKKSTGFELEGISYKGVHSVAMINGSILKVGDRIGGFRVTSIQPDRVILTKGTKTRVLNLAKY